MTTKKKGILEKLPQLGRRNVQNIPALLEAGLITPEEADELRRQDKARKEKEKAKK